MTISGLTKWAEQQLPICSVAQRRLALQSEEGKQSARIAAMQHIARSVLGGAEHADLWVTTSAPTLGGLAPVDLARESEEGSQFALRALIRRQKNTPAGIDG